ncbi:MAG: excalibur calcium-binding domain-containing protein [Bacteroidota bacterium]
MKHVVFLLILAVLAWQGYGKYQQATARTQAVQSPIADLPSERPQSRPERPASPGYRCDGRIYCSQMTSCEEATWVLKNCPGTKMDGNNDGIPCEKQWCK